MSQAKFELPSVTHRVKYIVLNLESNATVPSFASVFTAPTTGSGVLHLPFLSWVEVNKSMNASPVMGSSPLPVDVGREEEKTSSSPFFEAYAAPKS